MILSSYTFQDIVSFLQKNGWSSAHSTPRFVFFAPPSELGFEKDYLLPVSQLADAKDYQSSLDFTVQTIANIYEKDPSNLFYNVGNYIDILKTNAIYFKIESNAVKYKHTLEISYLWTFLKNLTSSYEEYAKTKLGHFFEKNTNFQISRIEQIQKNFISLSRLRLVDLQYRSFSFGVSVDTMMDNDKIEIPQVKELRKDVLYDYNQNVIKVDYNSEKAINDIRHLYSEDERKKIFKPLIDSINNDEYSVSLTDSKFNPKQRLLQIPESTVKIIVPPKTKIELEKNLELVQVLTVIDKNNPHLSIKTKDLENNLFIQKPEKSIISLQSIEKHGQKLNFKNSINFDLSVDDAHQKIKIESDRLPKLILTADNIDQVNAQISDSIFTYYEFYKHLKNVNRTLDESEEQIIHFFDTYLSEII